jgi:ABC-2 type transport system permease protein
MNLPLFKATLRANWMIALVFTLFILIYVVSSIGMFDPVSAEAIDTMLSMLPEGLVKALGFANLGTDLTGYIANYLGGFILLVFPMIYCAIIANRLVAKHVDSGSMAYLLTTPHTRVRIATTQAIYLIASLGAVLIVDLGAAALMSAALFPGQLAIGEFLAFGWVTYLVLIVIAGIGFFSSCVFDETRYSLALGAGLPVLFLIFRMVSTLSDYIAWMRYLTVYSFVDIERILDDPAYLLPVTLILVAVGGVLFAGAVRVFDRRSLAL